MLWLPRLEKMHYATDLQKFLMMMTLKQWVFLQNDYNLIVLDIYDGKHLQKNLWTNHHVWVMYKGEQS